MTTMLHPNAAGATDVSGARSGAGRGPIGPRFAFPVIDRVVRARPTRVLGAQDETATIRRIWLERPRDYDFRAGQHALLRLGTDVGPDLRPLSLAGPPDSPYLEFATRAGTSAFKQAFAALRPGDHVKVSRPMGGVAYDPTRPAVFVTGGLGITPVRSMLLAPVDPSVGVTPVRLLYSNRSADDVAFAGELSDLERRRPDMSVTWVVTGTSGAALPGPVRVGRLSTDLLRAQAAELPDAVFYVTGPAAMVSDVEAELGSIGVARRRIRHVAQGSR